MYMYICVYMQVCNSNQLVDQFREGVEGGRQHSASGKSRQVPHPLLGVTWCHIALITIVGTVDKNPFDNARRMHNNNNNNNNNSTPAWLIAPLGCVLSQIMPLLCILSHSPPPSSPLSLCLNLNIIIERNFVKVVSIMYGFANGIYQYYLKIP